MKNVFLLLLFMANMAFGQLERPTQLEDYSKSSEILRAKSQPDSQWIIKQLDSLKFIDEMPYICKSGVCGSKIYWDAVRLGESGIELLIDKLDDSTTTAANVILFGGNYTVADIAYNALSEIIHDIPTFKLLGVSFDKKGCGYCSYWRHLNKKYSNRQKFKKAVKNWYHQHKGNLVWVKSDDFSTCDCHGKHPNGGHFEVKPNIKSR